LHHIYPELGAPDSGFYLPFMTKAKLIRLFRRFHKWQGIIIAFFAILYALSGIVLNHRETFSSFDIPRKLMPPGYQYSNWNLAGVRGSTAIGGDSILLFGNIGVWLTDNQMSSLEDFNHGFPKGIDKRKIYALRPMGEKLVAATHFGLYATGKEQINWQKVNLPFKEQRLTDLALKGDTLLVLTRSHLAKTTNLKDFTPVRLPKPIGYERKVGLFNTLWELHSGELFGLAGRLFVDILGVTVIWLSVSGLLHYFYPGMIRRRKKMKGEASGLISAKRFNLHWHNVIGYIAIAFLIINTIAGMFLRPPLLIPIASKQVGIIPYTHLDNDNAWHDRLRRVTWNDSLDAYLFSTSAGFYASGESLIQPLIPVPSQPPVSVMGLNVFEPMGAASYLVGSFTGMYVWNLQEGSIYDFITGKPLTGPLPAGRPVGTHMVAGWVTTPGGTAWWFDYNLGAIAMNEKSVFPEMTDEIINKTPSSWWGAALEIHTGRIFEHLIGPFYLLIVPLAGLCMVIVLISGFLIWWMVYRKIKF
jgi:hypothetical protein